MGGDSREGPATLAGPGPDVTMTFVMGGATIAAKKVNDFR
jgi:hypothetical protein